ncbi:MAG TPA: glycosyltransferase [Fibrobacteria bacterium]|nr:glycosyltransferase [Fibrobacteria bacterium]
MSLTPKPVVVVAVPVLESGYGVATVALAQGRILRQAGFEVRMVVLRESKEADQRVLRSSPFPWGFPEICRSLGAGLVIVHGPPFLGFAARPGFRPVHWEHGMVFPEVLAEPQATKARHALAERSRQCASAELAVCPSRWLADRLNLPLARVIPNGADHLSHPNFEKSPSSRILLTVLRTGTVEDQYKGLGDLVELPARLGPRHPWKLCAVVTGPGDADHHLRRAGWEVFRDVSSAELGLRYAEASVYLAPSRCESFDLPLVEGQRSGAAGLAFAGSAHPETCPHLYTSVAQAAEILGRWNGGGLAGAVERSRTLAEPFTWANHGRELLRLVRERWVLPTSPSRTSLARALFWRCWWSAGATVYGLGRKWLR